MYILIAYLLGILTGIKRIYPVNKTKNTNDQGDNGPPVMRAVTVHIPPEVETKKESKYRKKRTLDVGMAFVHTGTMLAVIWYAILTNQILKTTNATFGEVQEQTTLMHQQLVGTQAAVVVVNDYPGIESAESGNYGFNIGLRNDGHVIASKVSVILVGHRETVNGAKPIGEPWHCNFELAPILPTKIGEHQCFLEGMNKQNWKPIGEFKQTIAVDGRFSYWNGFEDSPAQSICLRYVPGNLKSTFGSEGPARFVTCDRYPGWIEYLKMRMAGNAATDKQP